MRYLLQGMAGKNGKHSNLQGYLPKPAIRGKLNSFAGMCRNHERAEVLERETSYSATRSNCNGITDSK